MTTSDPLHTAASRRLIEDLYAAAGALDYEIFFQYFSDDVVVHEPSFLPYGGQYVGIENVKAMLFDLANYLDATTLTLDAVIADGHSAMSLIRLNAKADGSEARITEHFTISDGKIAEVRIYVHEGGSLIQPSSSHRSTGIA
jgi:uncharacterized protein